MLSTLAPGPRLGPHIIVIGNHKGGSGKSTVAMHIIVALLKSGRQVAAFDLDLPQQSLTHYIENRREWARQHALPLELPKLFPLAEVSEDGTTRSETEILTLFTDQLATVEHDHDF